MSTICALVIMIQLENQETVWVQKWPSVQNEVFNSIVVLESDLADVLLYSSLNSEPEFKT